MVLELSCPAFKEGGTIPKQYTCSGEDNSPPLSWSGVPVNTKSLVLIVDDPDAPSGTWVHWVLYNIPAEVTSLPAGIPKIATVTNIGTQGSNDFRRMGYGGPCPPPGTSHRYYFKLYALDTTINLNPGTTKAAVDRAIQEHILAQSQLIGKYGR
jgi:Raf kinase inhibitor-like YbhB/YbcL family protein